MKTFGWTLLFVIGSMAVPACLLNTSEGIEVELGLRGVAARDAVSLRDASIHLDASLSPCDPTTGASRFSLRSVARAHHPSADGRYLGPHVVRVVEDGAPAREVVGVLRPAPGRYCALHVAITPAGEGSDGLDEAMRDLALSVEGERDGAAIAAHAYGNRHLELALTGPDGPTELALGEGALAAEVELEVDLARALAAVPDEGQDAEELGLDLLTVIERGLTARVVSTTR